MRFNCLWRLLLVLSGIFLSGVHRDLAAAAEVESVTITSEDQVPAARWMYGQGEMPKADTVEGVLAKIRQAQLKDDSELCLSHAAAARTRAKSLQPWIAVAELDCAARLKPSPKNADRMASTLDRVGKNSSWLLKGPQASLLRQAIIRVYLASLDQDIKSNRARTWRSIQALQEMSPYLDDKAKAKMWRTASELSFLQQKPEAAREFIRRSLAAVDAEDLRARLAAVEAAIGSSDGVGTGKTPPKEVRSGNPTLEASKEELELVERVTTALKSGDLVPAVEDAAKLLKNFPGSSRAKWASDRILEAYQSLVDRTDERYAFLREQLIKKVSEVDPERMADWARALYSRGQYEDSYVLSKRALDTLAGTRRTGVLDLAAKAALATDKMDAAVTHFDELILRHSGTTAAREAQFRVGLIHYRVGRNDAAAASFEKLIAIQGSESFEVLGRYWLWRTLQRTKSERAASAADELIRRYPFSYYGLRARLERNGSVLEWKDESPPDAKVQSKLWLTGHEKMSWERVQILLKAGWLEEAQAELRELPLPIRAEDKAIRSLFWAAAGQNQMASKLAAEAWDEKAELRKTPFVIASFPNEFTNWVTSAADVRKLEPNLVRSLIRQESSYNARAVSSANAMGLMQMVPPTAREIAVDLKLGAVVFPEDMFRPERNIQMGTYYLSRMISKYQGHVPLGLAAYNAGPARIDRWIRSRGSLRGLPSLKSSQPDDEIWIDELPYWETSFYVKAILRNLLIHRMLDRSRVVVADPIWIVPTPASP